ncbi:hypothetical protein X734_26835 [Mesorhizobium sp. L2C084A000]|nr:hypothetical protein X734_26835 [Mesorhizobium sp. L2C084A000]
MLMQATQNFSDGQNTVRSCPFRCMTTSTAAALQTAAMADLPGLSLEDLRGGNLAMAQQ